MLLPHMLGLRWTESRHVSSGQFYVAVLSILRILSTLSL